MLRPIIPTSVPLENIRTILLRTRAPLRRLTSMHQTILLHLLNMALPLGLQLAVSLIQRLLNSEWRVHAAEMLGEQVFAIELVAFAFDLGLWAGRAAVVG